MIYRILSHGFDEDHHGRYMRVDDFEDHETTLREALAEFDRIRKEHKALSPNLRFILVQELDSFET
jgi:hypothetical protein